MCMYIYIYIHIIYMHICRYVDTGDWGRWVRRIYSIRAWEFCGWDAARLWHCVFRCVCPYSYSLTCQTCIHWNVHTYIHTYMYAYIHTCIHVYKHTYTHDYTHADMHTGILTYPGLDAFIYTYGYTEHTHTCMHVYTDHRHTCMNILTIHVYIARKVMKRARA